MNQRRTRRQRELRRRRARSGFAHHYSQGGYQRSLLHELLEERRLLAADWVQLGADIDGESTGDLSATSVSLSSDGSIIAIGAPYNDAGGSDTNQGHTRILRYNTSTESWTPHGNDIPGFYSNNHHGHSVSLSADGNRVIVGAEQLSSSGQITIFRKTSSSENWIQLATGIGPEATGDNSGFSVSMSADGNTIAIGAPTNDGNGNSSGHTRIYRYTGVWGKLGDDIDGEAANDESGYSVSLSADGNTVAIGAINNDGNGLNSGHTRILRYNVTTETWEQLGTDLDGEEGGPVSDNQDRSGWSVSLSADGNTVAIGARKNDGNGSDSGHTRIYRYNSTAGSWNPLGDDIDGEAAHDYSGYSVSLSADGNTVAIGAPYNDDNGGSSGHARVYRYNATTASWSQLGRDLDGEGDGTSVSVNSGWSVSLSADGNTVAVGAPYNDGNGIDSGQAKVFYLQAVDDLGDAPFPYPVTFAEGGAVHEATGPQLGSNRDVELDGTHSAAADADGVDEDGVTFGTIQVGQLDATVTVNVQNVAAGAKLDAWIDFNGDGSWGGAGEQIADTVAVVNGDNTLEFDVPSWTQSGQTFARFRLSTAGDLGIGGAAEDGEVEDYQVSIDPPAPSSGLFGGQTIISNITDEPQDVFAVDLDDDGDMDVLSASAGANGKISWFENDGNENFSAHTISSSVSDARSVFAVDIDGDGDVDVLSASFDDDRLAWYENDGSQQFTSHDISTTADGASSIISLDMDADGDMDVLSASFFGDQLIWHENDGNQTFIPHVISTTADGPSSVDAADLDGDGDVDIFSASTLDDKIAWYENDGSQQFTAHNINSPDSDGPNVGAEGDADHASSVFVADVDSDGDLDVVSASEFDDKIAWYENNGSQNFTTHIISTSADYPKSVFVTDVDGDGDTDVLSSSAIDNKIAWYQNDGDENFTEHTITTSASGAQSVFAADIDNDGDLDVLSGSYQDDKIAWHEQNATPTLDAIADMTIEEDAEVTRIELTGITAGGSESQPLQVTATSSDPTVILDPTVKFQPQSETVYIICAHALADQSGAVTITVTVEDAGLDGDLNTSGDNATFSRTFEVTVNAVNDAPHLAHLSNLTIQEDTDEIIVHLADINAGGGEIQPLRVTAVSSDTDLIPDPTVDYTDSTSLTNGLVASYSFTGNALDESGNGHDGIVRGASLTTDRFGSENSAYSFDGTDDWIELGSVVSRYDVITMSAWVKPANHDDDRSRVLIGKPRPSGGTGANLGHNSGKFGAGFNNHPVNVAANSASSYTKDEWHLVTHVNDGSTVSLYVDGILAATAPHASGEATSDQTISIGKEFLSDPNDGHGFRWFQGDIDDVRFYNRALISDEVGQLYNLISDSGTLAFTPIADANGTATITVTVEDGGLDGDLETSSDNATFSRTFDVNVTPVNDAPVNVVPAAVQQATENQPLAFTEYRGNGLSIEDPDAGDNDIEVTLTATHGTVSLVEGSGVTYSADNTEVYFTMKLSDVALALSWVVFTPETDYTGNDASLTITTSDLGNTGAGGSLADSDTIAIHVSALPALADSPGYFTRPSELDADFGDNGVMIYDLSDGKDLFWDVINLANGKHLATGVVNNEFSAVRLNADWTLDTAFADAAILKLGGGHEDIPFFAKELPDGKILLFGDNTVYRISPSGVLDTTFGTAGATTADFVRPIRGLAIQADGTLVVTGSANGIRYSTFSHDGTWISNTNWNVLTGLSDESRGIHAFDDGTILTVGTGDITDKNMDHFAAILSSNSGSQLSTDFLNQGLDDQAIRSIELYDGSIAAVGTAWDGGRLLKYLPTGQRDISFAGNGSLLLRFGSNSDRILDVEQQSDGKLVAFARVYENDQYTAGLIRLNSDGSLDNSFSGDGLHVLPVEGVAHVFGGSILPDTTIVLTGKRINSDTDKDAIIIRTLGDSDQSGTMPPTLDPLAALEINEDAVGQVVNLTGISDGELNTQPLRVSATSSDTNLVLDPTVDYTDGNSTGSMTITTVADQSGTVTITATIEDGGLDKDLATGGDNLTFSRTFDVTVNPVNDAPQIGTYIPTPTNIAVGADGPGHIRLVDLNGDDFTDIVTSNGNSHSFSVLLGQADGQYSTPQVYNVGTLVMGIAIGDVNNDDQPDVAVARYHANQVGVYLGSADGSFSHSGNFTASGGPFFLSTADFDGDNNADIAVATADSDDLGILISNGDGTFQSVVKIPVGDCPDLVIPADLNNDGKVDLAVEIRNGSRVAILIGKGDGTFEDPVHYYTGDSPRGMTLGDFNNDGNTDVATANYFSSNIGIALGNGVGGLDSMLNYDTFTRAESVVAVDYNNDGNQDLFVTQENTEALFFQGDGQGGFELEHTFPVPTPSRFMVVGDVNGDAKDDMLLATAGNYIQLFLNQAMNIMEDAPQQTIDLTGINAGPNENQPLKLTATSSDTSLIPDPTVDYPGSTDLTNGLVAYYPFDGNPLDESGHGHDGAVTGASLTTDRYGTSNGAYSFDGTDDWIDLGNVVSRYDVITMSAWVKTTNTDSGAVKGIVSQTHPVTRGGSRIGFHHGQLDAGFLRNSPWVNDRVLSTETLNDGNWHLATHVNDGSTFQLYVDGQLNAEGSYSPGPATTSSSMLIGKELHTNHPDGSGQRFFQGEVDDVRIYDRPLSASEVASLYNMTTGTLQFTPLVNQYGTATITVTVEDGGLDGDLNTSNDNATFSRTFDVDVQSVDEDFGDAPAPYPVTTAEAGPWHVSTGPTLGTERDSEDNGTHSADATADDTTGTPDDEDGVTFGTIQVGQLDASVTVNVQNAAEGAKLDAWLDFNGDGSWGGPGEQIADTVAVVDGDNVLEFDVPSWAQSGQTFARFRLSTSGDLGIGGAADDGEVEDVQVTIDPPVAASGLFGSQNATTTSANGSESVFAVDLDGDGDQDVLLAAYLDKWVAWYENDGTGQFGPRQIVSTTQQPPDSVFASDVDGDGDMDVLAATYVGNTIAWYENDGNQNFTAHTISTTAVGAEAVLAADIDGDGDIDVFSASRNDGKIAWYENDGNQNFATHIVTTAASGARNVFAADVDSDGDLDLLSASRHDDKIAWYENNGSQNFTQHVISTSAAGAQNVFAIDLDDDGDTDVLSASYDDAKIAWYENDGAQNFSQHILSTSAHGANSVFASDIDGDGDVDILSASQNNDTVAWYENDGSANFTPRIVSDSADLAGSVLASDMDGDGDLDVLSVITHTFAWYENNATPTLNAISDMTIEEDADLQTVDLTGITAGGSESQPLQVTAVSSDADLIPNPVVTYPAGDWLTDGLVASYSFSGNALDESGNGHDGSVTGASLTTDRYGTANGAYSFDGTDDWIDLGNVVSRYDVITISAWVKTTSTNSGVVKGIVSQPRGDSLGGARIGAYQGQLDAGFVRTSPSVVERVLSAETFNDGNWHLATHVNDGSTFQLYVDGQLQSEMSYLPGPATTNSSMLIGKELHSNANDASGQRFFQGEVDDVRVYNRPLSASEITDLYAQSTGILHFSPLADQNGTATITVTVEDGGVDGDLETSSDNATFDRTFDVTVTPVNDAPVAADASYQAPENSVFNKAAAQGLSTLVTDVDQDNLTFALVTAPNDGQLVVNADGSYQYTPAANFNLHDSFTYRANDGTIDSNVATVTLQIETSFPWHNGRQPLDVNQDSTINPLDVLVMINLINSDGAGLLPTTRGEGVTPPFVDVNRDGYRTASDILAVIDYLNQQAAGQSAAGEGEGEATVDPAAMALAVDLLMSQQTGSNEQLADRSKPQILGTASPTEPIFDNSPYWQQAERRFNHFRGTNERRAADISDRDELFDEANWLEGVTEETLQDLIPTDEPRNN